MHEVNAKNSLQSIGWVTPFAFGGDRLNLRHQSIPGYNLIHLREKHFTSSLKHCRHEFGLDLSKHLNHKYY